MREIQSFIFDNFFEKLMVSGTTNHDESLKYLNEYFDFNPSENRTEDKVFGNKAIFTNELLWSTLQKSMYDVLGGLSFVVMFQLGQKYGIALGDRAREKSTDVQQAVGFLEKYGLLAGWGKFHTTPFTLSGGRLQSRVTITVEDNFFARTSRRVEVETPQCFLLSGILSGIAQGLLGEPHTCYETKCMVIGDPCCEFKLITDSD